jgi:hypothetical protein
MRASCSEEQGVEPPLQPSDVVPETRATLPAVPDIRIGVGSTMSAVGRGRPTAAWLASWTRMYCPGAIDPARSTVCVELEPKLPVPVALAYWSDISASETLELPRLKSSMKSCV